MPSSAVQIKLSKANSAPAYPDNRPLDFLKEVNIALHCFRLHWGALLVLHGEHESSPIQHKRPLECLYSLRFFNAASGKWWERCTLQTSKWAEDDGADDADCTKAASTYPCYLPSAILFFFSILAHKDCWHSRGVILCGSLPGSRAK